MTGPGLPCRKWGENQAGTILPWTPMTLSIRASNEGFAGRRRSGGLPVHGPDGEQGPANAGRLDRRISRTEPAQPSHSSGVLFDEFIFFLAKSAPSLHNHG